MRDLARVTMVVAVAIGCGLAQGAAPEKHVKDIRAEQPQAVISASPLCQRARAIGPYGYFHTREVNPATLELDLSTLMQKSDEVVLAGSVSDETKAISPSGEDVVEYFDVKVLRTWKGSRKVGDLLTFAVPWAHVYCGLEPRPSNPIIGANTYTGSFADWEGLGHWGPWVLFLRQSRGVEKQLVPGFRLAGADGIQGLFLVRTEDDPTLYNCRDCNGILPGSVPKCNAVLDASQAPVSVRYRLDPLKRKYDEMPLPNFLKEVQSVADSLGFTADSAK